LKTAGRLFVDVRRHPPEFDRQPSQSTIVKDRPPPSMGLAAFLAVRDWPGWCRSFEHPSRQWFEEPC